MTRFRNPKFYLALPRGPLLAASGIFLGLVVFLIVAGLLWKPGFQEEDIPGVFWFFVLYKPVITTAGLFGGWITFGLLTISTYLKNWIGWKGYYPHPIWGVRRKGPVIVAALSEAFGLTIGVGIAGFFSCFILILPLPLVAILVILIALSLFLVTLVWLKHNLLTGIILWWGFATVLSVGAYLPANLTHLHLDDTLVVGKDTFYLAARPVLRSTGYVIFRCEGSGLVCQRVFSTYDTNPIQKPRLSYESASRKFNILDGDEVKFSYQAT